MGNCLMSTEFWFRVMRKVLEMDGGYYSTVMWISLIPLRCILKNGKF